MAKKKEMSRFIKNIKMEVTVPLSPCDLAEYFCKMTDDEREWMIKVVYDLDVELWKKYFNGDIK